MYDYEYNKVINVFRTIEKEFPVDTLEYRGLKIWPIIKVNFIYQLISHKTESRTRTPSFKKNIKQKIGDIILAYKNYKQCKIDLTKEDPLYGNLKVAFPNNERFTNIFLTASTFSNKIDEKETFNTQSDPFLFTIKNKENCAIFELRITKQKNSSSGIRNIDYLMGKAKTNHRKNILQKYIRTLLFNSDNHIETESEKNMVHFLKKKNIDLVLDHRAIKYDIDLMFCMKNEFRNIFLKLKPKNVLFPVYINLEYFAATLAAKELNINTIEVQHGVYDKIIYTYHQDKLPDNGYCLLPNYFFSWDSAQAKLINSWSSKTTNHRAYDYGINPIRYWQNNKNESIKVLSPVLQTTISNNSLIHILFTISGNIDKKLVELIIATQDSCFWYIRNHPRALNKPLIDDLIKKLETASCKNYEAKASTKSLLYPLLEKMDYHVTISSSVACESLEMKIPTIIISQHGRELYEEFYHENPFAFFLENTDDILKIISRKTTKKPLTDSSKNHYFEDFLSEHQIH